MEIGMKGSYAHVLGNDKIQDKKACTKELTKEALKDTFSLTAASVAAGGVAAGGVAGLGKLASLKNEKISKFASGALTKINGFASSLKEKAGNTLSKVSVDGTSVKEILKNTKVYQKFSALPAPLKAAAAVGTAALAVLTPIFFVSSASKAGYIEGSHESK